MCQHTSLARLTATRCPSAMPSSYLSDILVPHSADLLDVCRALGDSLEGVAAQDQLILLGLGDLDVDALLHDNPADELLADEVSVCGRTHQPSCSSKPGTRSAARGEGPDGFAVDLPDLDLVDALRVLVQVDVDGEMGVNVSHLVLEALGDTDDQVVQDGADSTEGGDVLADAVVDVDGDDVGLGLGEADGDVGQVLDQLAAGALDGDLASLDVHLDCLQGNPSCQHLSQTKKNPHKALAIEPCAAVSASRARYLFQCSRWNSSCRCFAASMSLAATGRFALDRRFLRKFRVSWLFALFPSGSPVMCSPPLSWLAGWREADCSGHRKVLAGLVGGVGYQSINRTSLWNLQSLLGVDVLHLAWRCWVVVGEMGVCGCRWVWLVVLNQNLGRMSDVDMNFRSGRARVCK